MACRLVSSGVLALYTNTRHVLQHVSSYAASCTSDPLYSIPHPTTLFDGADHVSTSSRHHLGHMFLTLALPLPQFPDLPCSPPDWAVSRQRGEGGHECHVWRGWKFTESLLRLHKWSQLSAAIKGDVLWKEDPWEFVGESVTVLRQESTPRRCMEKVQEGGEI